MNLDYSAYVCFKILFILSWALSVASVSIMATMNRLDSPRKVASFVCTLVFQCLFVFSGLTYPSMYRIYTQGQHYTQYVPITEDPNDVEKSSTRNASGSSRYREQS